MVTENSYFESLGIGAIIVGVVLILVPCHFLNTLWLKPKKLEKCLRDQGFRGNSYRPIHGDLPEINNMMSNSTLSKPPSTSSSSSTLSHDFVPRILPFLHLTIQNFGKESFMWYGRTPRINITKPELIREIFNNYEVFAKKQSPAQKSKFGLVMRDGEDWAKVRRIVNPAFHKDKLKNMLSTMEKSCDIMIQKWEDMVTSSGGFAEVDVYSFFNMLSGDIIAKTAFGTSYEEGRRLFKLQDQYVRLIFQQQRSITFYIPGWRFLPTKMNQKKKKLDSEVKESVKALVDKRIKAMETIIDDKHNDDLLSIMLESNEKEIKEHGNGLPIEEVLEECKLFFLAGKDTTAALLTWALVLLSQYQDWQTKAREEVLFYFGKDTTPNYEGLHSLKIVNMIINETLRLYPPASSFTRRIHQNTKLKQLSLLPDMELNLAPILVHRDTQLWGDDANEFNPRRFSEGISNAAKVPGSFIPFGGGPRVCIGQNFSLIETKLSLTKILQRFSFELSPSYVHSPMCLMALVPQFGAPLILHKI